MEDKARCAVVEVLTEMDMKRTYSNIKLGKLFKKYDMNGTDRAFATEVLFGTLRWRLRLDYMLQKFSKIETRKLTPWVLNCLRIAVYQMFFLDKVPEFAAVNQSVELAKMKEAKSASFVNGVLRNILRNKNEFNVINENDEIKRLSIEFSHPEWLIKKLIRDFGKDFALKQIKCNNVPPELTIRVNKMRISRDELLGILKLKGIEVKEGMLPESLRVKGYSNLDSTDEFKEGLIFYQSESSMLAADILAPIEGETVFDLCSAPGGKSTHIAEIMGNKGNVMAFDIYPHKLKLIRENAQRLGINIIKTELQDATVYNKIYDSCADRIIVDAPCTGLGLIAKKPEIRWRVQSEDILGLKEVQLNILENAARYLKEGGTLVYSTCTITREENEDVINSFLKKHTEFKGADITGDLPEGIKTPTSQMGYVKLFSHIHGTDGFFIAKMIKG